jgi:hypothetical protein
VFVHRDGYAIAFDGTELNTPNYYEYLVAYTLNDVDHRLDCTTPLRFLVFVHGGLNSYATDFKRMVALLSNEHGLLRHESTFYPYFVNWNGDFFDSIVDDVGRIRLGQARPWWVNAVTAPFVLGRRVLASVVGLPMAWTHSVLNFQEGQRGAAEDGDTDLGEQYILAAPLQPIRALTTSVLEAFGTPAWDIMKRRAQLAAASRLPVDQSLRVRSIDDPRGVRAARPNEGAARTFIEALKTRISRVDDGAMWNFKTGPCAGRSVRAHITLVGHSMGAIVLNRLLLAAAIPATPEPAARAAAPTATHGLPVDNVVYMAPAASVDEFDAFVLPYLRANPRTNFWLFTLSRKDEAREIGILAAVVVPRGSLLAWIDHFFEPPTTVGQGTLGRSANVRNYYVADGMGLDGDSTWAYRLLKPREAPGWWPVQPPFDRERVRVYVAINKPVDPVTGDPRGPVPRHHGEFTEPRFLGEILCRVDPDAFAPGFCTDRVYRIRLETTRTE